MLVFLLAVVSIAGGLVGVALGPPPGDSAAATGVAADSEYRFLSGTWLCCGVLALWSLRRPAERAHVTQAFLAVALVGGLGRLVSLLSSGSPGPLFVSALTVELVVVPLVLVWHRRHYRGPSRQRT